MILVTGGLGYIGSHTVVEMVEKNEELIILDNLSNSKLQVLDKIHSITEKRPAFYQGDIRDPDILEKIFSNHAVEAVIHFAGLKAVGESVNKPIYYYDNNITGTLEVLKVMKKYGCKKMVFSSSATVYGNNPQVPFREDYDLSTTNPYGASKRMIEDILRDVYTADPEWSITLLRYFNPIGAHKSGLIGEDPNDIPNNLLPYVSKVATGELDCLCVFGDDYKTLDGTGVRDYIHVVDLARGHLKALDYVRNNAGAEAINLGTGNGYSVLQVVKAYEKASERSVNYKITSRRPGDIASCYACVEKANRLLDWHAKYDLNQMCEDAWRFAYNENEKK
ncbi:UDP-glucose 4-epimerase GalE [Acidaminobacter sp. JC074]|uniref:UDP-glucose 4-epimerase GalE n=1 Tax=Acidaminobacter sp. JC074 TaxID=2530199 RepID=UPI001F0D1C33|nr:UDP-glucose 4-epimerase GalE [Acidaminobacter sp. JC074]MCH4888410.1 UDP-glucose 4-epimerase GalE [Acidaminobacter sp. JC074]